MSSGPKLTEEDKAIWGLVTRTVSPLPAKPGVVRDTNSHAFVHIAPAPKPVLHKPQGAPAVSRDRKIRKGKIEIDGKIDLHDMTRDQAYPALIRRLTRARAAKKRCVLVVTGKGPRLEGVLRTSLAGWLATPEIRPMISSYAPAHIRHGGSGAFYVFLKRA